MALTLNDERVRELFVPHLEPDETEVIYVAGASTWRAPLLLHIIFGMFASLLTVLRSKWYLLGLTERRLMLLRLTITMQEKEFEAFPLSEIRSARIRKRFLERVIEADLYNGGASRARLKRDSDATRGPRLRRCGVGALNSCADGRCAVARRTTEIAICE